MLYKHVSPGYKLRTHTEFQQKEDEQHIIGDSPLRNLRNFDCVLDFSCDIMHTCHLGKIFFKIQYFLFIAYSFNFSQIN